VSDRFDFLELDNSRPRRLPRQPAGPQEPIPDTQAPTREWKVVELIGGPGAGVGQFASPGGLAVDRDGNLYVADSYNHRVQRITPTGEVWALGRRGTGPGEFLNPQAVVTDGALGFYVLEQGGCRIQRFGPNGEWQGAFGFRGRGWGDLSAPMAMARGPCGALFVADSGNNRIVKWSSDDVFLACYPPPAAPPLARPQGITVDGAGRIWVAETLGHRVLVFDALFRPLGSYGSPGDGPGQFCEPQDLAVTSDGCLLVADTGNNRLQVLDRQGRPLQRLDRVHAPGAAVAALDSPSGLALRGDDEAYVADTGNHRILRLARG
jgi:tripartite motif-containing protein 71